jgi:hypothetical protein
VFRAIIARHQRHNRKQEQMKIISRPMAFFAAMRSARSMRWIFVAAVLAAMAAPSSADARRAKPATIADRGYDGYWNVLIITQAGPCDQTYNFPFQISGGRISSSGGALVSGRVARGGSVAVRVSAGESVATGSGRLGTGFGAGRWVGRGSRGVCSGRWQATRGRLASEQVQRPHVFRVVTIAAVAP